MGCMAAAGSRIADLWMAVGKRQRGSSLLAGEMENHPPVSQPVSDALADRLVCGAAHADPACTGMVALLASSGAGALVGLGLSQAPINASSALKSGADVGDSA